jgi:hypothetical protein
MTKYVKNGNEVRVIPDGQVDIEDRLPAGLYAVNEDRNGLYLTKTEMFKLPEKVFGDVVRLSERIIATFKDRKRSTGVLLSGVKGSGKTLLMKYTAVELEGQGFPVLVVNDLFDPSDLAELLRSIDDECAILFDEFEKNYGCDDDQESLLTLFDGTIETKKLYMLTCNDLRDINYLFLNRPGRVYYHIEHTRLSDDVIEEFCELKLNNRSHLQSILKIAALMEDFSFDILDALVEEVNRYGIPPAEALSFMNIRPSSDEEKFNINVYRGDELLKVFDAIEYDPLGSYPKELEFDSAEVKKLKMKGLTKYENDDACFLDLTKNDLVSIRHGVYTYNVNGYRIVSEKIRRDTFDLRKLLMD